MTSDPAVRLSFCRRVPVQGSFGRGHVDPAMPVITYEVAISIGPGEFRLHKLSYHAPANLHEIALPYIQGLVASHDRAAGGRSLQMRRLQQNRNRPPAQAPVVMFRDKPQGIATIGLSTLLSQSAKRTRLAISLPDTGSKLTWTRRQNSPNVRLS